MGLSAGLVGVGGALAGLFGGGNSVPSYTPSFSPAALVGNASQAGGVINPLVAQGFNLNSVVSGNASAPFGTLYSNQGWPSYLQGANTASNMGKTGATNAFNAGQSIYPYATTAMSAGANLIPGAFALEQLGFDPQSQLYNQTVNDLTQQINVANSQSGISTSPYGASVEANALGNFNINWQNNQLQRALAGAQGAGNLVNAGVGAINTGANTIGTGAQIAGTAPISYLQSSMYPYAAYSQQGNDQFSALNDYTGAITGSMGPLNTQLGNIFSLMGSENQTNQQATQAYQAMLGGQNQQFLQNQLLGSALGRSLGGIGGLSGGGTGGNVWSGLNFSNSPLWGSVFSGGGNNYFGSQDAYSGTYEG